MSGAAGGGTGAGPDEPVSGAAEGGTGAGPDEPVPGAPRPGAPVPGAPLPGGQAGPVGPVVVLIGPPGAGKTTVGRELARRLGTTLHDTDEAVEQDQGRTISDIFVQDGEAVFRELERAEVVRALRDETGVLALGGGAVMQDEVEQSLRAGGHRVVFLDVTIADASKRVGFDASRPLLLINPRASWTRLMNARRPTYESLATISVDTGGRTPEEIADEVLRELGPGEGEER